MSRIHSKSESRSRAAPLLEDGSIESVSPAMRRIAALVERIAPTDRPVLLLGPTGSGKEVLARCIHRKGLDPASPFLDVNCSAIPESLMETELFGHERGAFTGAVTSRPGHFALVGQGTLFLDEIGDLPLALQPKLLRVLETRQYRSIGSGVPREFQGRIVAATHRQLATMVAEGSFREDLYYRLNVFPIQLPSLAERREDIPILAQRFASLQSHPRVFADEALLLFRESTWPGNIRQLRNVVDQVCTLCDGEVISAAMVAPFLDQVAHPPAGERDAALELLLRVAGDDKVAGVQHLLVDKVLRDCEGNKSHAAKILGVNRKVVERRVQACADRLEAAQRACASAEQVLASADCGRATKCLERALQALRPLPPSIEERKLRFSILVKLGICWRSREGWLSDRALRAYTEALSIGQGQVESRELNALRFGNWTVHLMRLELDQASRLAQEIRLSGIELEDVELRREGCLALANTRFWLGEYAGTLEMLDELRALPGRDAPAFSRQGMDPVALATMLEGLAALELGDEARLSRARLTLEKLCKKLEHAYTLAIALQGCAWIECLSGHREASLRWAERLLEVAKKGSFAFYRGLAEIVIGASQPALEPEEAARQIRAGFEGGLAAHGGRLFHSVYRLLLARHWLEAGEPGRALAEAKLGIEVATEHRERAYLAELMAARGQALLALGDQVAAEDELRSAREVAVHLGCVPGRTLVDELMASILQVEQPHGVPSREGRQQREETLGISPEESVRRSPDEPEINCA